MLSNIQTDTYYYPKAITARMWHRVTNPLDRRMSRQARKKHGSLDDSSDFLMQIAAVMKRIRGWV
jgi:hypothetical protein